MVAKFWDKILTFLGLIEEEEEEETISDVEFARSQRTRKGNIYNLHSVNNSKDLRL